MESVATRHSCAKVEVQLDPERPAKESIFVKGTWSDSTFHLDITDGLLVWNCHASASEVRQRAEQWDLPPAEYVALAERYLGFQQPCSRYTFEDAGDDQRRLSWTFETKGTKLEWRWKCQQSSNSKQMIAAVLDFLMDANIRLSEEVVMKTQSFEKLKVEAEACLSQCERLNKERAEFESVVYSKFVAVLNTKKAKLRELRDKISTLESAGAEAAMQENESSDGTKSYHEGSDDISADHGVQDTGCSKMVTTSRGKGSKKRARK